MNNPDTPPKPPTPEQPADEGLDETACSLLLSHADTKRVLNAVHERAWKLLHVWQSACHASYRKPDGTQPTKAELDMLYEGQKAHFALQGRIQEVLKANAEVSHGDRERQPRLVLHLRSVLEYAERETCTHEETHRGGAIWEICDSCGKKWADDEGGKPNDAHDLPQVLTDARDFLHSLQNT